jgi:hypothetical protein
MASKTRSQQTQAQPAKAPRQAPPTFEMAVLLCPHEGTAQAIAESFGLIVPEFEQIKSEHERALKTMWLSFEEALNEKATEMHFQRIVGSLVSSAVGAGNFYSAKLLDARAATARAGDGGQEQDAPVGLESKAQRAREFAADMAMQAYTLLAAAAGAVAAYKEITGQDWRPYQKTEEPGSLERRSVEAQMNAFG